MQGKADSIWSFTFVVLLIVNFFMSMGQMMMNNIIPLYARSLSASATLIGFVVSAFPVAALAVRPIAGPAFDSFSKKRLLQVAYAVLVVTTLLYAAASSVPALFAVRLLHGVSMGCIAPLAMSYVGDILPASKLGSGVSVYTLAQAMAQVIGPAAGIELSRVIGYPNTFIVAGVCASTAFVLILFIKEPPIIAERPKYKISLNRFMAKKGIPTAVMLMFLGMTFASVNSFIAIYAELQGMMQIGLYFSAYAIALLVSRPVAGRFADKHGTGVILIPALCCYAVAMLVLSVSSSLPGYIVVAVLSACGYGVSLPLLQALVFKCVPRKYHGAASNTNYIGMDFGMLIGPLASGALVDVFLPQVAVEAAAYSQMFLLLIVPIAATAVAYVALKGRIERYSAETAAENEAELAACAVGAEGAGAK